MGGVEHGSRIKTTEVVTQIHSGSQKGFDLEYGRGHACSIKFDYHVVITGGWNHITTLDTVSRYDENGWQWDLPNLNTGRSHHGCTWYWGNDGNNLVYLVAGGLDVSDSIISSAEILPIMGFSWSYIESLPS